MKKNKFNIRQTIILFFAIGLMLSCSEHDPAIQKLHALKKIDFDKIEGARTFITPDGIEAWEWRRNELEKGRGIYGRFDKKTGRHIQTSIPKEKNPSPTYEELSHFAVDEEGFLLDDKGRRIE
jgi:hypothetical protein